jgi:DNA repair protein NreA
MVKLLSWTSLKCGSAKLYEIIGYRLSLVRGVKDFDIQTPSGRYIESLQELAMANKPVESEATFGKRPIADIEQVIRNGLNTGSAPFGPVAALKTFRTSSSISVDRRLEDAYYDKDLQARCAILSLYEQGIDLSKIQRIFSLGMLGTTKKRRWVPTRWSISAIDDTISSHLVKNIETNATIDRI